MRRLAVMLALGFDSGLPLLLSGFTLRQFLVHGHVAPQLLALTAWIGLVYNLKFLWAPVLDHVPAPGPLRRLGRRRGWILLAQPLLVLAIAAEGFSNPAAGPLLPILLAVPIALCSATQDIAIDAWRIESFALDRQGIANALYVWGYRVGMLAARTGVLAVAAVAGWRAGWLAAAALAALGMIAALLAPEPPVRLPHDPPGHVARRVVRAMRDSLADFLSKPGAAPILAYVILFTLGEGMAGVMLNTLYQALGFSDVVVAVAGPYVLAGSVVGIMAGGALVARLGVARGLIATGFFQMATMAMYVWLARSPGDTTLLYATNVAESFAQGCATAAFLAYLSGLCSTAHTATQFALLTSLAPLSANLAGGLSGFLAARVGLPTFYALAMLASLPGMLLMLFILGRYRVDWANQERAQAAARPA
jgi:PAT family beta-lactamase induction signal transducer AmpG